MPSLCALCGLTLYPQVGDVLVLVFWSLEAAARGAVVALLAILWARLFRWRVPFWPTLVVFVAFAVGRVWA